MGRYKIIKSGNDVKKTKNSDDIILHKNISDILFKHREEVHNRLIDLRGTFLIDHIAIKIINPSNEIVIFSMTPSVEYNLIVHGLWKHDNGFSRNLQNLNKLCLWEDAYSKENFDELKSIKEFKHGFTFGFYVPKKQGEFNLIYSFATRSNNDNLNDYYQQNLEKISVLGDYGYRLIHDIYSKYCYVAFAPSIKEKKYNPLKSVLKLIVNNNYKATI